MQHRPHALRFTFRSPRRTQLLRSCLGFRTKQRCQAPLRPRRPARYHNSLILRVRGNIDRTIACGQWRQQRWRGTPRGARQQLPRVHVIPWLLQQRGKMELPRGFAAAGPGPPYRRGGALSRVLARNVLVPRVPWPRGPWRWAECSSEGREREVPAPRNAHPLADLPVP